MTGTSAMKYALARTDTLKLPEEKKEEEKKRNRRTVKVFKKTANRSDFKSEAKEYQQKSGKKNS